VRLFLASYRLGPDPSRFRRLLPAPTPRVAVIANAADAWPPTARDWAVRSEFDSLRALGAAPEEVDLREWAAPTGARAPVADVLAGFDAVWVRGGNTFVLRAQLARSGADSALKALVRTGALVYGGYSAGACVLAPTLRGLELVDDPAEARLLADAPLWEGLGLVPYRIVPHFRSPGHEESAEIEQLAALYAQSGVPFRTLTDDEVIVVDELDGTAT
jgi:dipeptidase E